MKLPANIEAAKTALGSIEGLVTARQWERAAIVWAFTHDHPQGQKSCTSCSKMNMSEAEFADLRIAGLRTRNSVRSYRAAWRRAMAEAGSPDVKPGSSVDLPGLAWAFPEDASPDRQTRFTARRPAAFADSLGRGDVDPEEMVEALDASTATTIARKALDDPDVRRALVRNNQARDTWAKAAREEDARSAAKVARKLRQEAPKLIEAAEYYDALGRVHHAGQDVRQAIALVIGLPPLDAAQRGELTRVLDRVAAAVGYLRGLATSDQPATLADEIADFLAGEAI